MEEKKSTPNKKKVSRLTLTPEQEIKKLTPQVMRWLPAGIATEERMKRWIAHAYLNLHQHPYLENQTIHAGMVYGYILYGSKVEDLSLFMKIYRLRLLDIIKNRGYKNDEEFLKDDTQYIQAMQEAYFILLKEDNFYKKLKKSKYRFYVGITIEIIGFLIAGFAASATPLNFTAALFVIGILSIGFILTAIGAFITFRSLETQSAIEFLEDPHLAQTYEPNMLTDLFKWLRRNPKLAWLVPKLRREQAEDHLITSDDVLNKPSFDSKNLIALHHSIFTYADVRQASDTFRNHVKSLIKTFGEDIFKEMDYSLREENPVILWDDNFKGKVKKFKYNPDSTLTRNDKIEHPNTLLRFFSEKHLSVALPEKSHKTLRSMRPESYLGSYLYWAALSKHNLSPSESILFTHLCLQNKRPDQENVLDFSAKTQKQRTFEAKPTISNWVAANKTGFIVGVIFLPLVIPTVFIGIKAFFTIRGARSYRDSMLTTIEEKLDNYVSATPEKRTTVANKIPASLHMQEREMQGSEAYIPLGCGSELDKQTKEEEEEEEEEKKEVKTHQNT